MAEASTKPLSVLFVCLGNICRSPMAEGVFRHVVSSQSDSSVVKFANIDSAGTGAYHELSPPDSRTMHVLRKHGITSYNHAARKVRAQDFEEFDYLFAMDSENLEDLEDMRKRLVKRRKGENGLGQVMMFGAFGGKGVNEEVIDPYYGGQNGFDIAYEQMQRFTRGFLKSFETSVENSKK